MSGKVYLVGAGPGDPDLLTMKAARLLRTADAVLHDELVSDEILRLVPNTAQLYNVGKRYASKKVQQQQIHSLMVALAEAGLQVVRLKGGDPMIFGRAGEEIAALRRANIEFEIVPGITAALGAASSAQIPLTHRENAHAVVFLAGHSATDEDHTNWRALVDLGASIVVYMPGPKYSRIAQKLSGAGLSAATPCAIISRATTQDESVYWTQVSGLHDVPQLPAPTLLVIGEVLRHAAQPAAQQQIGSWIYGLAQNPPAQVEI